VCVPLGLVSVSFLNTQVSLPNFKVGLSLMISIAIFVSGNTSLLEFPLNSVYFLKYCNFVSKSANSDTCSKILWPNIVFSL
jgi:hypothetical protein